MNDIYVVMCVIISILSYNLISDFFIKRKQKYILSSNRLYFQNKKYPFANKYINKIESNLFNLGYPYKLTTKKYLILKYLFSIIVGIVAAINYKNIKAPVIFYLIIFFTPNYLLYGYKRQEKSVLINEIKKLTSSIILNLTAECTLEQALMNSKGVLNYARLQQEYDKFIYEYKMNGYNLKRAVVNFQKKFSSYELSLFLNTLAQGEVEGNLIEALNKYTETLELNYFKYIKKKSAEKLMYVTLGTVLTLIDIILIIMYPIFMQVMNNLQIIFS